MIQIPAKGWRKEREKRFCIVCGNEIKVKYDYPSYTKGLKFCSYMCRNSVRIKGHKFNGLSCPKCGKCHKDKTGKNNVSSRPDVIDKIKLKLVGKKKKVTLKSIEGRIKRNEKFRKTAKTKTYREKLSLGVIKAYAEGKMKCKKGLHKMTNPEYRICEILDSYSINHIYTGNSRRFSIKFSNGKFKFPDVLILKSKLRIQEIDYENHDNKVIEFLGDYWHKNIPQEIDFLIKMYKEVGYSVLCLTYEDLKDESVAVRKILNFCKGEEKGDFIRCSLYQVLVGRIFISYLNIENNNKSI